MVQVKSGLPSVIPPPAPYKEKEVLRPLRESSVDLLRVRAVHCERSADSDVIERDLVIDQAEFNVVLDRWFGELALIDNVLTKN